MFNKYFFECFFLKKKKNYRKQIVYGLLKNYAECFKWNKLYINIYTYIFSLFFHMALLDNSFYLTLPSHDLNKAFAEANTPFKFTVALPGKMRLDIEQWEVRLVEMFIPDYGFNINHPQEESLKITYERVIEDEGGIGQAKFNTVDYIGTKEGCYFVKEWVNKIND